ncbi:sialoadhesin-like [Colossoma macropomum]|uniref:sialoadhesin-like n=1 Tax=Colossoma macropomum TaxID=42526 RepID=UPI001863BDB8|nr:sialoadhesin-like [Colossoma macropomum]
MSEGTMCSRCGVLSLIILLFIPVSGSLGQRVIVSCSPQTVCALRESAANLICSYSTTTKPQQIFWFSSKLKAKWRNEEDPEDLALDSDYAGRVRYTDYGSSSTLTITDLRERDSGEYQLMIITGVGERSLSSAVRLTVSDLQVMVSSDTVDQKKLTCITSCNLTSESYYHWSKNGGRINRKTNQSTWVLPSNPGSYSCSVVTGSHEIYSSAVCVFDENCWNVRYSDRRLCAVEGSSVDFLCTYSHPSKLTVNEAFWHYESKVEPKDLSLDDRFAGRVQFLGNKKGNCTLRMRDVRKNNSGEYHFRFVTNTEGFFGKPGVILNVSDLQVRASPSSPSEGQTVTLTCTSTCTLPNNPTYIWYKNGEPVTNKPTKYNKLYLESASSEDIRQYSCALGSRGFVPESPEGSGPSKFVIMAAAAAVCLILILIAVAVWIWRRKSSPAEGHRSSEQSGQCEEATDNQDDVQYSSVHFRPSNSPVKSPSTASTLPPDVIEEVHYADVKISRRAAATQPLDVKATDDPSQIYSQIQKRKT